MGAMMDDASTTHTGSSGGAGDPHSDIGSGDGICRTRSGGGSGGTSDVRVIPGPIVAALARVQASIEAVSKSGFNKHGQYKYSSVDDIYAAVTLKLGEAGIIIYPLELEQPAAKSTTVDQFDKEGNKVGTKTVTSLTFRFGYVLATEQHTWFDPRSARTITVQHTGPQTYNGAESYCQKAFLRGLFKLPTGDMDLDSFPQADTVEDQVAAVEPKKRKSSSAAKKDGTTDEFNAIRAAIASAIDLDHLRSVRLHHESIIATLPERWASIVEDDFVAKSDDLRARMT